MSNLTRTADYLTEALEGLGFVIMSERAGQGLPLVAFRFAGKIDGVEEKHYDEFALAHHLRSRGWVVPAYTMAPRTNKLKMLRVVVREDFSRSRCDMLITDIKLCVGMLDETDRETVKRQEQYIKEHVTSIGKLQESKHKAHAYKASYPRAKMYGIVCTDPLCRTRSTRCKARLARPTPLAKYRISTLEIGVKNKGGKIATSRALVIFILNDIYHDSQLISIRFNVPVI